jgi:TatD DNase family protein
MKMANLTDTHCHIDLYHDPKAVVAETEASHIYTIAVTNIPSVYPHMQTLCNNLRYIRPAVGLHPELAPARHKELTQMWQFLSSTRYVGEVGLDYTTEDLSKRDLQLRVFDQILVRCAEFGDKILTVHSRRAASDVVSAIGENYPGTIILHWYSGSVRDLNRAIEYGYHFSVNFSMLKSEKGRKLVAKMPRDRVLTETDGPFIMISKESSRPVHISRTTEILAELWEISVDDTRARVFENFCKLLDRASPDSI